MTFQVLFQIFRAVPLLKSVFKENRKNISIVANANKRKLQFSNIHNVNKNVSSLWQYSARYSCLRHFKHTSLDNGERVLKQYECNGRIGKRMLSVRETTEESENFYSAFLNKCPKWCRQVPCDEKLNSVSKCEKKNISSINDVKELKFVENKTSKLIIVVIQRSTRSTEIETPESNETSSTEKHLEMNSLPILESSLNYTKCLSSILAKARTLLHLKRYCDPSTTNIMQKSMHKDESSGNNYSDHKFSRESSRLGNTCLSKASRSYSKRKSGGKNKPKKNRKRKKTICKKISSELPRPKRIYDDSNLKWKHQFGDESSEDKPLRMDDVMGYKTKVKALPKLTPSVKCTYSREYIPTIAPKFKRLKKIYDDSDLQWKHRKIEEVCLKAPRSDEVTGYNEKAAMLKRVHAKNCKLCVKI